MNKLSVWEKGEKVARRGKRKRESLQTNTFPEQRACSQAKEKLKA